MPDENFSRPAAFRSRTSAARVESSSDRNAVAGFSVEPVSDNAVRVKPMTAVNVRISDNRGPVRPGDSAQRANYHQVYQSLEIARGDLTGRSGFFVSAMRSVQRIYWKSAYRPRICPMIIIGSLPISVCFPPTRCRIPGGVPKVQPARISSADFQIKELKTRTNQVTKNCERIFGENLFLWYTRNDPRIPASISSPGEA